MSCQVYSLVAIVKYINKYIHTYVFIYCEGNLIKNVFIHVHGCINRDAHTLIVKCSQRPNDLKIIRTNQIRGKPYIRLS